MNIENLSVRILHDPYRTNNLEKSMMLGDAYRMLEKKLFDIVKEIKDPIVIGPIQKTGDEEHTEYTIPMRQMRVTDELIAPLQNPSMASVRPFTWRERFHILFTGWHEVR